jgi:hypothetical protein
MNIQMILWSITSMIILFSQKNVEEHEWYVGLVMDKPKEIKLYNKLEKCEFCQTKLEFFGHIISKNDIWMDPHKVQTTMDLVTPTYVHDVQCFIGFIKFYQYFIAHCSMIVTPLIHLFQKHQPFAWGVKYETIFQSLKVSFMITPSLIHLDPF